MDLPQITEELGKLIQLDLKPEFPQVQFLDLVVVPVLCNDKVVVHSADIAGVCTSARLILTSVRVGMRYVPVRV